MTIATIAVMILSTILLPASRDVSADRLHAAMRLAEAPLVRELVTVQLNRISMNSDGSEANNSSFEASLSADGRFVAFESNANNLVLGDTNETTDIFVHDCDTRDTTRVSIASNGSQANGRSAESHISADGRFVVFRSAASNLVPGDTNNEIDIFVHDRSSGETTRVSVASDGSQANDFNFAGRLSADGRFVSFGSDASNLVPGDSNAVCDSFVHDRLTGQTTRVSVASDGSQANDFSFAPGSLSADGRFIVFDSDASNLVPGDTNMAADVFVHDRQTGGTTRVSVASDGTQGNHFSLAGNISANGQIVVFTSSASNLVPGDANGESDILVHDRLTGQTTRINVARDGTQANGGSADSHISADGQLVVFESLADNIVPGDTNHESDIFVHDRGTGQTLRVSVIPDDLQANGPSQRGHLSADGQVVAFSSLANNLASDDANDHTDIFAVNLGNAPGPDPEPDPDPEPPSMCDCDHDAAIVGTPDRDVLFGTRGDDIICALGGHDTLFGLGGNDCLDGGEGDDRLSGASGADLLDGRAGNDHLLGGAGEDMIFGGDGDDVLRGEAGDDVLHGDDGDDVLHGGDGGDALDGGPGQDACTGGTGEDDAMACENIVDVP
ncbi:calcium-binding protein [Candidatus Entotheonella palauensis]|uniref:calcium-binding protein n=1 Tax=Candidatus Entotheonella palauensis TaxID=93172 RepID=UPI002118B1A6|nr:calcium-binding protein [Candidatus Entotheonella palauensis]